MSIKLYIGNEQADFNEEFNVMYGIGDIRDLSSGNSNKSYTLTLHNTPKNKRLLKHIQQVDVKSEPDAKGWLFIGEHLVISGQVIVISSGFITTKIIISADEWIDQLRDLKMSDIDLSAYDHEFTSANVESSWSASYPMYRYPMIDFGGLVSGESGATANWRANDFIPMISVSQLITKILTPYTISSSWLATNFVKDLFILAREIPAPESFIKDKDLLVSVTNDTDNDDTTAIPGMNSGQSRIDGERVIFVTETKDEGGDFYSDTYTVPESGTYRFKTSLMLRNDAPSQPDFTITGEEIIIAIVRLRGASETTLNSYSDSAYSGTELINGQRYDVDSGYWHCEAGDEIYVKLTLACNVTNGGASSHDLSIGVSNTNSTFENVMDTACRYAGLSKTISLEEMLPDMTQIAFITAIKEIFNLKFWTDKSRRVIYIEPNDTFNSGTIIDLTNYVDFENIDTDIITRNYNKSVLFKWKDDTTDVAYTEYLKLYPDGPGTKTVTLTSEFALNGEMVMEHPFSGMVAGNNYSIAGTVAMPRIWAESPAYPYNMFNRKTGFNTRIVEWKGLTSGFTWYYHGSAKTTWPKVQMLDFTTIYSSYWLKTFHLIDRGKLLTVRMKINQGMLNQFYTVVNTAANEAFRPIYKITIKGVDNYFYLQKITSNGVLAECELILKS